MNEQKLQTKTKNINNQRVFEEIDNMMIQVFTTLDFESPWTNKDLREQLVEMVEMFIDNYAVETGKIIQYDVICDSRNNTAKNFQNGPVKFTIRYRQKNCLNTTEIEYLYNFK